MYLQTKKIPATHLNRTMRLRQLTEDLQEKAIKELNEVPDRIESDIETIKEWIKKQPHLDARTEDQWILGFLRGSKFSLQRTKEKFDTFYSIRKLMPEFFANRDPSLPEIQDILKMGIVIPLNEEKDSSNTQILFFRWQVCDPEIASLANIMKVYFMIMDILLYENDNCITSGKELIVDYTGFPVSYVLQLTPVLLKQYVICMQKAYPIRFKGIYNVNAPAALETIFNIFKGLVSAKLKDRTFLFGKSNFDQVYSYVPKSRFFKEYGGNGGSIEEAAVYWKNKVESYRDWFLEDAKYGTNEELRTDKAQIPLGLFGVAGSFRKLAID